MLIIQSSLNNREHEKQSSMNYLSMLYTWYTNLWKYDYYFFNCIFKQIDQPNRTKPTNLVQFLLWYIKARGLLYKAKEVVPKSSR